jgi:hypothetical protein
MKLRQNKRMEVKGTEKDKINNPLITIPGTPGIGKSTFFAHFPESEAYIDYSINYSTSKKEAIVSTFTFNSGMEYWKKDLIGLRIMYGTLVSMGLLSNTHKLANFDSFINEFFEEGLYIFDYGYDAIVFLQNIFGEDRKYLILVDEISKANDDVKVMRDLGEILNKIDNCDIVVSSLSPQYINKLLTGSQRNINYVILPPLLYSNLGKEECKYFYKKILQCAESKNIILNNVDEFKKNLIENAYLLCSGHPRTIEGLVNYMNNIDDLNIDKFISFIKSKRLQLSNMVFEYCNTLINNEERISIGSSLIDYYDEYPSKLSKILFSHPTERSSRNEQFRYELDNNLVMIFKKVGPKSFLASVQAIKLLDFISEDESFEYKNEVEDDKLLSNGLILLNEIKKKKRSRQK